MAIANPRIHMICGICGSRDYLSFRIDLKGKDIDGEQFPGVKVSCGNCASLTDLGEVIREKEA